MLKKVTKILIEGKSVVSDTELVRFFSSIDTSDPYNINFSNRPLNSEVYKEHLTEIRSDEAEFRQFVQSIQDEILASVENQ